MQRTLRSQSKTLSPSQIENTPPEKSQNSQQKPKRARGPKKAGPAAKKSKPSPEPEQQVGPEPIAIQFEELNTDLHSKLGSEGWINDDCNPFHVLEAYKKCLAFIGAHEGIHPDYEKAYRPLMDVWAEKMLYFGKGWIDFKNDRVLSGKPAKLAHPPGVDVEMAGSKLANPAGADVEMEEDSQQESSSDEVWRAPTL